MADLFPGRSYGYSKTSSNKLNTSTSYFIAIALVQESLKNLFLISIFATNLLINYLSLNCPNRVN